MMKKNDEPTVVDERVYVLTNAIEGNRVAVFTRAADGTLLPLGGLTPVAVPPGFADALIYDPVDSFPTGGFGSGGLLVSQGALALSKDGRYLFAVNPGSNEVSSLAVTSGGLRLVSKVDSGGVEPTSLTVHEDLLYVVNGFGTGQIAGFTVGLNGILTPLEGSRINLSSAGSGPAQISFNHHGNLLVVTELFADRISVVLIDDSGLPKEIMNNPSAGQSPFGFAFNKNGHLIVSESFGFRAHESAVSSYAVKSTGELAVISASVPTCQTAACWIANTPNGQYSYTSNTGSGSITGYNVEHDGELYILNADGRTGITGDPSLPIDMVISRDGKNLYVLNQAQQTLAAFEIQGDGGLTPVASVGNLPPLAVGLAIG